MPARLGMRLLKRSPQEVGATEWGEGTRGGYCICEFVWRAPQIEISCLPAFLSPYPRLRSSDFLSPRAPPWREAMGAREAGVPSPRGAESPSAGAPLSYLAP